MKITHYKLIEAKRAPHGLPAISRYMCGVCKVFHVAPDVAELCCDQSCKTCGEPLPAHRVNNAARGIFWACEACNDKVSNDALLTRLRKADVIPAPTSSFVYTDALPDGYINLDDYNGNDWTLAEIVEDVCRNAVKPVTVPSYIFDCDVETWAGLNLPTIVENTLEEWFDDAESHVEGMDELQAAIDRFNDRQTLTQYHQSGRIIILDPVAFQTLIAEVA